MLKFRNRNEAQNRDLEFTVSMSSVQGGVLVEVDQYEYGVDGAPKKSETILLTPMDAACFVHETRRTGGVGCMPVGHATELSTLSVSRIIPGNPNNWEFVGVPAEAYLDVGSISMSVPVFVIDAMRIAMENMMDSLMYPSTGSEEEEFG